MYEAGDGCGVASRTIAATVCVRFLSQHRPLHQPSAPTACSPTPDVWNQRIEEQIRRKSG